MYLDWREKFGPGDLARIFKKHGVCVSTVTKKRVTLVPGDLMTVVEINNYYATVIFKGNLCEVRWLTEMAVNVSQAKPTLVGKHFCALSALTQEHQYFEEKVKCYGGGWSKKYTKKCTHILTRHGDQNAVQYSQQRRDAIKDGKPFISETDLAEMMGL